MSKRDFDSNYEIGFINGVQFGVYSPEMILKKSVVKIDVEALYDSNGDPRINGLFDPRMGYIEPRLKCKTCEQTYVNCPGHFGHIELPKPLFNLQFEDYIIKILRCVCIKCSRLLINKEHQQFKNIVANTKGNYKDRFEKIYKHCMKVKTCGAVDKKGDNRFDNGGCGAIQPSKYNSKLRRDFTISAEWRYETGENPINLTQELNAEIVLAIFKRITEDDALVMGFNKKWCMPSWLIITVLPVVPPSVRPSVRQYNSQRSEDDLTNKYYDIIKYSQMLRNKMAQGVNVSPEVIKQYTDTLQHSVITLFNNEIKDIPQSMTRGGRVMKTLRQRLSGKEGRIRNNLMGKRVDFSARSVISPDANLTIEELGVPYNIAMNLTFPEVVNKYNINKMYQLVRNGNRVYPGAKSIKKMNSGKEQAILDDMDTSKIVLDYGDTVNRHLVNGDIILFNRQPSLHKMSMMAHRIRVMTGNTFRLNVDVCKPYNADFDGDEMNAFSCVSLQTAVEIKYLAAVSKMIISPSENKPIIQPAQDNLLGLFKITDDNVFFTQQEFMNMLVGIEKFNGVLPDPAVQKEKLFKWTGKQLYSIILPPITYTTKTLVIEDGILKKGQVEKKASNNILHQIYNDYGHKEATRYLNDLQRLITRYIVRSGFSVGISDLIVPKEIRKKNEEVILQSKRDIVELTKKVHLNILEDVDDGLNKLYDTKIAAIAGKTEEALKASIMKDLTLENRVNYIISSGSKGKDINIQQMMCLVGPQAIDGKKDIPKGFTDRTLPHYPRYEGSAESRGFITSNFLNGLNPQEFFFHAMAGREGVIDTAVKTASSGYLQRKLVKSMEDLKVAHDMTVRSSNNDIVQFCYGYDGFESVNLEIQKGVDFIKITLDKLKRDYYLDPTEKYDYVQSSEINKMKKIDGWRDKMLEYNKNLEELITDFHKIYAKFGKLDDNVVIYYPINFKRLITNTAKQFKLADIGKSDLHPLEIINEVQNLIEYTRVKGQRNIGCEILMWNNLAPKILLRDKKFNRIAFMHIINAVKTRYKYSLAEGGEMVGPLAAQSLGEKTTQMTLHSVDWETEILISRNGDIITPKIGEFIDSYYNECLADSERKKKIQYINDGKQIYIPLDDGNDWRAYSCDEDGKVMWTKLEAITRHPVVNEDGSETILEVELECGRIVKATKGKSFLVYNEAQNKIIGINGSELQVGDLLPVCEGLEIDDSFNEYTHLDLKEYLSPREYMFEDEMQKALNIMKTTKDKNWFNNNQGITFNIPYNTDKSFKGTNSFDKIKSGCVYPKSLRSCHTHIPAMIELNAEFGYFVGAYLADGMSNEYRIIISKQEISFIEPIKQYLAKWDIGYRYVESNKKDITEIKQDDNGNEYTIKKQWKSYDHIFQSTLFAEFIGKVFGKTCEDKEIPLWVLQAPKPFLQGLISGYFSGDGHISQEGSIIVSSVGYKMLQTIGLILNRFNINWTLHKKKQNLIKFPNAKEYIYNLYINRYYNNLFNEKFKLTINSKKERLNNYLTINSNNIKKLQNTIFKKILSINEILPTSKIYNGEEKRFVYDLTVATTKHFCTSDLLVQFDTFHLKIGFHHPYAEWDRQAPKGYAA